MMMHTPAPELASSARLESTPPRLLSRCTACRLDAVVMIWLAAPSGVSKDHNAHIPILSHAVRALQAVYIPYAKLARTEKASVVEGEGAGGKASGTKAPAGAYVVTESVTQVLARRANHPTCESCHGCMCWPARLADPTACEPWAQRMHARGSVLQRVAALLPSPV